MDQQKKILLISQEFPPRIGGAGSVAENTAKLLSEGNQVKVLTFEGAISPSDASYDVVETRYIKKIFPFFFYQKFKSIYTDDIDVIILNDIGSAMMACFFFNQTQIKKCILFLHGSEPETIFMKPSFLYKVTGVKKRYCKLLQNCLRVIVVSTYMKEKFLNTTKLMALEEKMIVVYNGIDFSLFMPTISSLRNELGISAAKILLSVSSIKEGKGYYNKYRIFKRLINDGCDYHWVIVGDGSLATKLKKMAKEDSLEARISFVGIVPREDLAQYYSMADAFWLLSNLDESLGLAYIEAIACETPAIGRNSCGAREIIKNGINGYLVNNDDESYDILYKSIFEEIDPKVLRKSIDQFCNDNILIALKKAIIR
ncbi:glycosyltransferase family 4 protein [Eubacteriales bacterium OttesenSCG-928-M02]|nr:glycosyltransferase family 4 protein [Eubacteriales bacterium OttesenSCG-928-M02]